MNDFYKLIETDSGLEVYSEKTGYTYDLLEGKSLDNKFTSDLVFILCWKNKEDRPEFVDYVSGASFLKRKFEYAVNTVINVIREYEGN